MTLSDELPVIKSLPSPLYTFSIVEPAPILKLVSAIDPGPPVRSITASAVVAARFIVSVPSLSDNSRLEASPRPVKSRYSFVYTYKSSLSKTSPYKLIPQLFRFPPIPFLTSSLTEIVQSPMPVSPQNWRLVKRCCNPDFDVSGRPIISLEVPSGDVTVIRKSLSRVLDKFTKISTFSISTLFVKLTVSLIVLASAKLKLPE